MYFITTKRMLEVCFSAHPNIQYRTFYMIRQINSCQDCNGPNPLQCGKRLPEKHDPRRNGDHGHQISKDTGLRQIQIGKCIVQEEKCSY